MLNFTDGNLSRPFLQARQAAGYHIQQVFQGYYGEDFAEQHEFSWIHGAVTYPAFDDLTFRFRDHVFSVVVAIGKERDLEGLEDEQRLMEQRRICRANNMVPCLFVVDGKRYVPVFPGIGLIHTGTCEAVDPFALAGPEKVEMSDWELTNFAISLVVQELESEGHEIGSYCDYPGITPQVWFGSEEQPQWCVVRYFTDGEQIVPFVPDYEGERERLASMPGYVADVVFKPIDGNERLYRSDAVDFHIAGGIRPVEHV
jgi:hypothetical protein